MTTEQAANFIAESMQQAAEEHCAKTLAEHMVAMERDLGSSFPPGFLAAMKEAYRLGFQDGWGFGIEKLL